MIVVFREWRDVISGRLLPESINDVTRDGTSVGVTAFAASDRGSDFSYHSKLDSEY